MTGTTTTLDRPACWGNWAHWEGRTFVNGMPIESGTVDELELGERVAHWIAGETGDNRHPNPVWWQPPEDARKDRDLRDSLRSTLTNVLEYGYCGLILELCEGTDAYGRPIVVKVASLWGIEPFPDAGYVAEVVADLAAELDLLDK